MENNTTLDTNWTTLQTADDISNVSAESLVALLAVQIVVLFLGVSLNVSNIIVLARGRKFGRRMRIQLINLAAADILIALFIPGSSPVEDYVSFTNFPDNQTLCQFQQFLGYSVLYASLLSHTAIAMERLVATCFPFLMSRYKRQHVVGVVVLIWLVAFLCTINVVAISNVVSHGERSICFANIYVEDRMKRNIPSYIIKFLIPAFLIAIMYAIIGFRLRAKKIIGGKASSKTRIRNKEVIAMLAVNATFAVMMWLPYFVFIVVKSLKVMSGNPLDTQAGDKVAIVLYGVDYLNCFITPVIYVLLNQDYRKDAREVLLSRCTESEDYDKSNSRDVTAPLDSVSNIPNRNVKQ